MQNIPVSFTYQGIRAEGLSDGFARLSTAEVPFEHGIDTIETYRHAASGTEWAVTTRRYTAYGATRYKVDITATRDTEVFDDLAYTLTVPGEGGRILGNLGDEGGGFAELDVALTETAGFCQQSTDGRPTHGAFPYYRIETDAEKLFCVLSWQGTWFADFRQSADGVTVHAGQLDVHTRLLAGERFRLPDLLLLPYGEDPVNEWRRFFRACIMPRHRGAYPKPMLGISNGACAGLDRALVSAVKKAFDDRGIDYDFWWFDAGWGSDGTGPHNKCGWWFHGLNLEMNEQAFPDGIRFLGEELAAEGRDFLLWFEPELVRTVPEELELFFDAHPDFEREWLLGTIQREWCGIILTARLFDLGNPACLAWVEGKVFSVMDRAGATIYRQDFNIPPAEIWAAADAPDRRGMTQNRYCCGYLQFLRDIAARYPGIILDSCASGGGRLDLETMELMLPLHYSDHQDIGPGDAHGHIFMQQILYRWFPYTKNNISTLALASLYGRRSVLNPCLVSAMSLPELSDDALSRTEALLAEWRRINRAFEGDYFELEPATRDDEHIKGYGFYDAAHSIGFTLTFFPPACTAETYAVRPQKLDPAATYRVEDHDSGAVTTRTGASLMTEGVTVTGGQGVSSLLTFTPVTEHA